MSDILTRPLTALGATDRTMTSDRIGDLFDRHHQRLYRLARRLSSDSEAARDLVQEAFLRAARRPGDLPADDSRAEAWLVRVVVNLCRDRYRRLAVRRRPEVLDRLAERPQTTSPESRAIARTAVHAALATLKPRRRAVVVLRELEGLPVAEVAKLLRMNQGTVRWHHSKGRKQLSRQLGVAASTAQEEGDRP